MSYLRIILSLALLSPIVCQSAQAQSLVRISEFMAVNNNSLNDEDGDEVDWIEIHNASTSTVNLAGWFLTDSTNNLAKWMFLAVSLMPPHSFQPRIEHG